MTSAQRGHYSEARHSVNARDGQSSRAKTQRRKVSRKERALATGVNARDGQSFSRKAAKAQSKSQRTSALATAGFAPLRLCARKLFSMGSLIAHLERAQSIFPQRLRETLVRARH